MPSGVSNTVNSPAEVWDYVKAGTHRAGSQNARVSVRRPGFPARHVVALINNPGEIPPAPLEIPFHQEGGFQKGSKGLPAPRCLGSGWAWDSSDPVSSGDGQEETAVQGGFHELL